MKAPCQSHGNGRPKEVCRIRRKFQERDTRTLRELRFPELHQETEDVRGFDSSGFDGSSHSGWTAVDGDARGLNLGSRAQCGESPRGVKKRKQLEAWEFGEVAVRMLALGKPRRKGCSGPRIAGRRLFDGGLANAGQGIAREGETFRGGSLWFMGRTGNPTAPDLVVEDGMDPVGRTGAVRHRAWIPDAAARCFRIRRRALAAWLVRGRNRFTMPASSDDNPPKHTHHAQSLDRQRKPLHPQGSP